MLACLFGIARCCGHSPGDAARCQLSQAVGTRLGGVQRLADPVLG